MSLRSRRRRRNRSSVGHKLLLGAAAIGALLGTGLLAVGVWVVSVLASAPSIDELEPIDHGETSVVYASDGTRLGYIASDEVRREIPLDKIPSALEEATVAIEDANFYDHSGVDYGAIIRAAFRNAEAGRTVEGGSTITQQLARNLYISNPERDLERKIEEAKLASELEDRYSKDEILEQYLNTASYGTTEGRTAVGVEAAAEQYFSKHASHLTLTEAALIAGLPQAPSIYNPMLNPDAAMERRNRVLEAMAEHEFITGAEAIEAYSAPLGLDPSSRFTSIREPFFFDFVTQQLIEEFGTNTVRKGGLEVHTTIDPGYQDAAREAIAGQLNLPTDPSAAVVTIDPENGHVLAMASSSVYSDEKYNLAAQGRRQPGSAFKTMVLTAAIREGINPATTYYASKPLNLDLPEYGHWEVATYSNTYGGVMDLVRATLASDNTVYAQLDLDVGPEEVRDTAYDLGITSELDALPAEGIGGLRIGVSPLEMASAYATLAANGVYHQPVAVERVEFPDGEEVEPQKAESEQAVPDWVAYEVTKILRQNVTGGTGTAANYGCPAAGKTGTTDDFTDAWFVGYTPDKSTAVWVGFPDANISMTSVHGIAIAGGTFPAQIWHDYMVVAAGDECNDFEPAGTAPEWTTFESDFSLSAEEAAALTAPDEEGKKKKGKSDEGGDEDAYLDEGGGTQPPGDEEPPDSGAPPAAEPPGGGPPGAGGGAGGDIPGAGGTSPD